MNVIQAAAALACFLMSLPAAAQPAKPAAPAAAPVEQVAIGEPAERMALVIWRPAGAPEGGARFPLVVPPP